MVIALVITELLNAGFNNSRLEGMTEGTEDKPASTDSVKPVDETKEGDKKDASKETENKKEMDQQPTAEEVKKVQEEIKENQDKIIQGFQEIEPYMNKAEGLVEKMNRYAMA